MYIEFCSRIDGLYTSQGIATVPTKNWFEEKFVCLSFKGEREVAGNNSGERRKAEERDGSKRSSHCQNQGNSYLNVP